MKKKSAFSIVELSLTLVVISIVTYLTLQAGGMGSIARLSSARSKTLSSAVPSIPGLVVWYETSIKNSIADNQRPNGSMLTTWYNIEPTYSQIKNNLTTTASVDVTFKSSGINKIPSIDIKQNGYMATPSFIQDSSLNPTLIIVFEPNEVVDSTDKIIIDSGASSNLQSSIAIRNNSVTLNAGTSASTATATNSANFSKGGQYIMLASFNGNNSKVYINNPITEIGSSAINPGTNPLSGLTIGADRNGANGISAKISEVIVYNRPLKTSERKDIMTYLSKKYAITVTGI